MRNLYTDLQEEQTSQAITEDQRREALMANQRKAAYQMRRMLKRYGFPHVQVVAAGFTVSVRIVHCPEHPGSFTAGVRYFYTDKGTTPRRGVILSAQARNCINEGPYTDWFAPNDKELLKALRWDATTVMPYAQQFTAVA